MVVSVDRTRDDAVIEGGADVQALLAAVPEPDPDHRLDLVALMEGRASDPGEWPAPFTIGPLNNDRPVGLVDLGDNHFVRADLSVPAERLIA